MVKPIQSCTGVVIQNVDSDGSAEDPELLKLLGCMIPVVL